MNDYVASASDAGPLLKPQAAPESQVLGRGRHSRLAALYHDRDSVTVTDRDGPPAGRIRDQEGCVRHPGRRI